MTIIVLTLILLALDQLSKYLAITEVAEIVSYNTGIAFSIPIPNFVMLFLIPIIIVVIVWLGWKHFKFDTKLTFFVISLLIAGGIGNFIDRLRLGAVIDFIDVGFWPSFNFADSYLVVAAFLVVIFHGRILKT